MHREATTPRAGRRSARHGPASPVRGPVLAWPTPHPPSSRGRGPGQSEGPPHFFSTPKKHFEKTAT